MKTEDDRRCPRCLQKVTTETLGGYSGKGALSGTLFCETCAPHGLPVSQPAMLPEVRDILEEFGRLDLLLIRSAGAVRALQLEPHFVQRQARLVVLAREYVRDCTVLAHRLNRMAMS